MRGAMSGSLHAGYSLRDLEALAGRQGEISGELELAELKRFAGLLHSPAGSVRASLRFRQRGHGELGVTLDYETTVQLTGQRCLEPYEHRLADEVELVIVEPGSSGAALPDGIEPLELDAGRLFPARLIEDELIVALPLVPKHAQI